ncbi:MAG: STAS domain-containing protein [Solirubrobacteraceae bacterium]
MPDAFASIESFDRPDGMLVSLRGEVDMSNVDTIYDEILIAIGQVGSASLDLSDVQYIDSQGLRMLKRLSDRLGLAGVLLTVTAPPDSIAGQLLAITTMSDYLRIEPS